eukprot:m.234943 g.234943  ORF g.234943 m.234943 type:complete len:523 (-) comp33664_c1_seq1:75-1643(-)
MAMQQVTEDLKHEAFNKLYIDGNFVDPVNGGTMDSINPASATIFHKFPKGGAADIDMAVAAAKKANLAGEWAGQTATERATKVFAMADLLEKSLLMLARVESADCGKTTHDAMAAISGMVGEARNWCALGKKLDDNQDELIDDPNLPFEVVYRRDPIGVVGLITAWNYPINVAFRKIAPALIAGNCAVVKPSEIAGLSVMYLAQLAHEAGVPKGVLNIVIGDRDAGARLTEHPDVSMVSFTGSSFTGSKVMASCSKNLSQCMLELGGKGGLVIFDDVDIDKAVETTMRGFLTNGGQICTAHTRLIVHESIQDQVLEKLKAKLENLTFAKDPVDELKRGDHAWEEGGVPDVVQPVVCESQYQKIRAAINLAVADTSIKTLTGGVVNELKENEGYFIKPTVFYDIPNDHDIWQNEIFGPVLAVRSFSTEAEAITEVNNSAFGLACTVMCKDPVKARRVAIKVRAGAVYCTDTGHGILFEFPNVQRGGFGKSGLGRELGYDGLTEYTELKSINYSGDFKQKDCFE